MVEEILKETKEGIHGLKEDFLIWCIYLQFILSIMNVNLTVVIFDFLLLNIIAIVVVFLL
jgi:hypothetical protein